MKAIADFLKELRADVEAGRYVITSGFGERTDPITGKLSQHLAVDIAPRTKQAYLIMLPAEGDFWIPQNPHSSPAGLSLYWVGDKVRLVFAHLESIALLGDKYQLRIGSTGRSTGPHLHLEKHVLTSSGWKPVHPLE